MDLNKQLEQILDVMELDPLTVVNVTRRLQLKASLGRDVTKEIDFVAAHVAELKESFENEKKNLITELGIDTVSEILRSDKLRVLHEDWLLDWILSQPKEFHSLLNHVRVDLLSSRGRVKLIDNIDEVSVELWKSICRYIKTSRESNWTFASPRFVQTFKYVEGKTNQLHGLFNYLRGRDGQINDNLVTVTVSGQLPTQSLGQVPSWVINRDSSWNGAFYTTGSTDLAKNPPWFCFEFKQFAFNMTHYTLRSQKEVTNNRPRAWVLEGSNDNKNWTVLDDHKANDDLKPSLVSKTYAVNQKLGSFIFFRIKQTGAPNPGKNNEFALGVIEFFGTITPYRLEYVEGQTNQLHGLFNCLRGRDGEINDNLVTVTVSGQHPTKSLGQIPSWVINRDSSWNYAFYTTGSTDLAKNPPWFCFEFKQFAFNMTHYTLRSQKELGCNRPRAWVLEGSNDNKNWTVLDDHKANDDLKPSLVSKTYAVNQKLGSFIFFRIKQTGAPNPGENNEFALGVIEFFGTITPLP